MERLGETQSKLDFRSDSATAALMNCQPLSGFRVLRVLGADCRLRVGARNGIAAGRADAPVGAPMVVTLLRTPCDIITSGVADLPWVDGHCAMAAAPKSWHEACGDGYVTLSSFQIETCIGRRADGRLFGCASRSINKRHFRVARSFL